MKGNRTAWAGIAACLALALVGSAQATAVIRGGGEGSTLRIAMSDGALRLDSSTLPAGRTLVRVTTTGHRAHALILARLHSGVTAARFARALHTKDGQAALALASFRGGIDALPPAGTTWLCFSDQVMHAAVSGQYMLEQTIHRPVAALYNPSRSPLAILERLTGRMLVPSR